PAAGTPADPGTGRGAGATTGSAVRYAARSARRRPAAGPPPGWRDRGRGPWRARAGRPRWCGWRDLRAVRVVPRGRARAQECSHSYLAPVPPAYGRPDEPEQHDPAHAGSHREVLRLRVVEHQGVGGLLRVQLQLLAQAHPDPVRAEQLDDLRPVAQVRAGRVAEGV